MAIVAVDRIQLASKMVHVKHVLPVQMAVEITRVLILMISVLTDSGMEAPARHVPTQNVKNVTL